MIRSSDPRYRNIAEYRLRKFSWVTSRCGYSSTVICCLRFKLLKILMAEGLIAKCKSFPFHCLSPNYRAFSQTIHRNPMHTKIKWILIQMLFSALVCLTPINNNIWLWHLIITIHFTAQGSLRWRHIFCCYCFSWWQTASNYTFACTFLQDISYGHDIHSML